VYNARIVRFAQRSGANVPVEAIRHLKRESAFCITFSWNGNSRERTFGHVGERGQASASGT
jgi:hypothetical protein